MIFAGQTPCFFFRSVDCFAGRWIRSCLLMNPFACELSSTFILLESAPLSSRESRASFFIRLFAAPLETIIVLSDPGSGFTPVLLADGVDSLAELFLESLAVLFSTKCFGARWHSCGPQWDEELLGFWRNPR